MLKLKDLQLHEFSYYLENSFPFSNQGKETLLGNMKTLCKI